MQANRRRRRAEWEFLVETNASGGQFRPSPENDDGTVIVQTVQFQCGEDEVCIRGNLSLAQDDASVVDNAHLHCNNNNENEENENSDDTEYDADTDTVSDDKDIDEEATGDQHNVILSDDDDSIFAAAASILVAESRQRFAGRENAGDGSDNDDDDVRSLNSFVIFDDPQKTNTRNEKQDKAKEKRKT